jgi:hypothetical protein
VLVSENPYAETLISSVKVYNLDRGSSAKYLRFDCPWCGNNTGKSDTKGHCHFYLDNSVSRCMRCGEWGTVRYLFTTLGLVLPSEYGDRPNFPGLFKSDISTRLGLVSGRRPPTKFNIPPEIDFPEGTVPLSHLSSGFLLHRKILRKIDEWQISAETTIELRWQWNFRMEAYLFPVYDAEDRLIYWASRSYDGKFRSSATTDFAPYGIIGNLHHPLSKATDTAYLVEGPRDSAALIQEGFWGLHLFGHNPNANQVSRLSALPHTKVVVLDADVTEDATALAEKQGWKVLYLPAGDPGDYAGRVTETLAEAWAAAKCKVDSRFAHIRQKLFNPQVRRARNFSS